MEKGVDFLDLSCRRWVFLWDEIQEKVLSTGQEALDSWQWYSQESKANHWRLVFPFRAGILQSTWAFTQALKFFFKEQAQMVKTVKRFQLLVVSANTGSEKQKLQQLVAQTSLRAVTVVERADFFNAYLQNKKNFSPLKLIIDLNDDFVELSLFLAENRLKTQHLPLADYLTDKQLVQHLKLVLDSFLLNLPRDLFKKQWQYFYIFMKPEVKKTSLIDDLNQHLKMEGILNQEILSNYV